MRGCTGVFQVSMPDTRCSTGLDGGCCKKDLNYTDCWFRFVPLQYCTQRCSACTPLQSRAWHNHFVSVFAGKCCQVARGKCAIIALDFASTGLSDYPFCTVSSEFNSEILPKLLQPKIMGVYPAAPGSCPPARKAVRTRSSWTPERLTDFLIPVSGVRFCICILVGA